MKPIEIKVTKCDNCPFWNYNYLSDMMICGHKNNIYDGKRSSEFIEHCPLKETETVIKFERDGKA